ncbi:M15 family metallopeptidase [Symbioplanes lichenis]|uniref:M15 family metallopeptidase n=1 Tax=Symbioplanes lichenis TaxID=1629072 RepID=UPI0027394BE8|nr:M15 family metallopeptidase [Actinoplanes lichenis]
MRLSLSVSIASAVAGAVLGPVAVAAPAAAADGYRASIETIGTATAKAMTGVSWHRGCPVPISDLRRVRLTYWGFDGVRHGGQLIVHKGVARRVVTAFHKLYAIRFPIKSMLPVERFDADDDASMAANNTSAFNCRPVTGATSGFSVHSYGKAIDINTVQNPYVKGSVVQPPAGKKFLNRARLRPGMIRHGDKVWRAFTSNGFTWGGDWKSLKDYQHFEFPV